MELLFIKYCFVIVLLFDSCGIGMMLYGFVLNAMR